MATLGPTLMETPHLDMFGYGAHAQRQVGFWTNEEPVSSHDTSSHQPSLPAGEASPSLGPHGGPMSSPVGTGHWHIDRSTDRCMPENWPRPGAARPVDWSVYASRSPTIRSAGTEKWEPLSQQSGNTSAVADAGLKVAEGSSGMAVPSQPAAAGGAENGCGPFSQSFPRVLNSARSKETSDGNGQAFSVWEGEVGRRRLEEEVYGSLEELEQDTIGKLLPDDEDDLLSGLVVEFDKAMSIGSSGQGVAEEEQDFDLFSSGGGLELGENESDSHRGLSSRGLEGVSGIHPQSLPHGSVGAGAVVGEHPYGEHPSRTLFVRNINSNVEDTELRALFEQYGAIRQMYTACKHRGFVMISYYDIRAARSAMRALQNKPLRRRKLDIHFSIPKENPSEKEVNQGTLVVFNLDPSVTNEHLRQIFSQYGEVKEIRETPHKKHHKFIEYYDIRAADAALKALNRMDIAGKRIKLEPSRPGGARRSSLQQGPGDHLDEDALQYLGPHSLSHSPPFHTSSSWSGHDDPPPLSGSPLRPLHHAHSSTPSLPAYYKGSSLPVPHRNTSGIHLPGPDRSLAGDGIGSAGLGPFRLPPQHPHSLPEFGGIGPLSSSGTGLLASSQIPPPGMISMRGREGTSANPGGGLYDHDSAVLGLSGPSPYLHAKPSGPSKPAFGWDTGNAYLQHVHASPGMAWPPPGGHLHLHGHSIGHPPPHHRPLHHHHHPHPQPPQASLYNAQSAPTGVGLNSYLAGESPDSRSETVGSLGAMMGGGPDSGASSPRGSFGGHLQGRSRRTDGPMSAADPKKQYHLDLEKIMAGEDRRTTLMVKNIPNKYTQKMLLAAIDEHHKGSYDFFYLPIDFKNKCNVGYAFINLVSPDKIVPFYQLFNGKKWEKFNSEKVASLAYARIQGRTALVAHFQNSSLMNEDKRCRPILFHAEGPNVGDQEPFPAGHNIRARPATGLTRPPSGPANLGAMGMGGAGVTSPPKLYTTAPRSYLMSPPHTTDLPNPSMQTSPVTYDRSNDLASNLGTSAGGGVSYL